MRDPCTGATHIGVAVGLALHVACAMLHLHTDGILHGDLKARLGGFRPHACQHRSTIAMLLLRGQPCPSPLCQAAPKPQLLDVLLQCAQSTLLS